MGDQLSFDDVQVGAAYAAIRDANGYFPACGLRVRVIGKHQGVSFDRGGRFEDTGFHERGTPHPPCFAKRVCKLLKTNNTTLKKRAKRPKERAKRRQSAENKRVEKNETARSGKDKPWNSGRWGSWKEANMRNDSMEMEDNGSVIH